MKVKVKESEDDVMNTLEKCYSSVNVPSDPNDINELTASGYRTLIITREKNEIHIRQIHIMESSSTFL